jgi:hypothetical protein
VRLLPWGFFADPWSPRPIDHLVLGFHVDFHIDVSGVDVCVSQPVADLAIRLGMSPAGVGYAVQRGEAIAHEKGYQLIQ